MHKSPFFFCRSMMDSRKILGFVLISIKILGLQESSKYICVFFESSDVYIRVGKEKKVYTAKGVIFVAKTSWQFTLQEPARIYDFAYFFDQDESENESIKIKVKKKLYGMIEIVLKFGFFCENSKKVKFFFWSLASVSFLCEIFQALYFR